jgi:hypothetical protein
MSPNFMPLSNPLGIAGTPFTLQLGKTGATRTVRLMKGDMVVAISTLRELDANLIAGFVMKEAKIPNLNQHQVQKTVQFLIKEAQKNEGQVQQQLIQPLQETAHEKQGQQPQKVDPAVVERASVEKLKKLVKVSSKLKISQMAKYIGLTEDQLSEHIVDWAEQFGFTLDEDTVIFGAGRKEDFIAALDGAFSDWGKKVETKEGKLE